MEQAIEASHGDVLGWWSRKTISLACTATGEWAQLAQRIGPSKLETEADAQKWVATVTDVVQAMQAVQREFDFEDKRTGV
jgi:hypothetical protein